VSADKMDPNENTKSGPGQNHDSPGPQDSARQPEEPGDMQAEPPRKCKICGSPNADGCGCEARQLREAKEAGLTENEAKALLEPEPQPVSEKPTPAKPTDEEILKVHNYYSWLRESAGMKSLPLSDEPTPGSKEAIAEIIETSFDTAKDIGTMAERSAAICDCLFDLCQYFKVVSEDLKTIKEILIKKDE